MWTLSARGDGDDDGDGMFWSCTASLRHSPQSRHNRRFFNLRYGYGHQIRKSKLLEAWDFSTEVPVKSIVVRHIIPRLFSFLRHSVQLLELRLVALGIAGSALRNSGTCLA